MLFGHSPVGLLPVFGASMNVLPFAPGAVPTQGQTANIGHISDQVPAGTHASHSTRGLLQSLRAYGDQRNYKVKQCDVVLIAQRRCLSVLLVPTRKLRIWCVIRER